MDKVADLKKALNDNGNGTPEDTEQEFYDVDDLSPDLLGSPTLEEKGESFWGGFFKTVEAFVMIVVMAFHFSKV